MRFSPGPGEGDVRQRTLFFEEEPYMVKVTFAFDGQDNIEAYAAEGESLLDIARKTNVAIDAPCSGNGACGKCRVRLLDGELNSAKTAHLTSEEYESGWRLACLSNVDRDITVKVPDIASAYKSRMKVADLSSEEELAVFNKTRMRLADAGISFTNQMRLLEVCLPKPGLDDTMPDNERLSRAVSALADGKPVSMSFTALKKLSRVLRQSAFKVKCVAAFSPDTVRILDLYGAEEDVRICGAAIDLGTTSVAAVIADMTDGTILAKASAGNGQIRYGADVINRIIEQEKEGGIKKLQDAIVSETINPMIETMCADTGISPDEIYSLCIAGNTTMNHLLCGVYADPIRMEPYIPSFFEAEGIMARDIGITAHPDSKVILAPNIGSYVGGDITAGAFASLLWTGSEMALFIDLGTNGELVLGSEEFMMSCACSAGPAFEGGDISCGMRASDGAIEKVWIDPETMEPGFRVIGKPGTKPAGICGSGIIDLISELFRCGIINPKGKFVRERKRVRYDQYNMGSYILAFRQEAASVRDIEINETDIDNFIRAKGAIFSGVRVMLESLGMTIDMIEHVYVAGGIGSGINIDNAVAIGMLPDIDRSRFSYIGNSSLSGAYAMLLSDDAKQKVRDIAGNMTYLELSSESGYMDEFVACCFLPHTDSSLFPSTAVEKS